MLALLAALLITSPVPGISDSVQPYEVRSASGEWRASVDPSSRRGDGQSNVRVERSGELAWQADLPFTLIESVLTDNGELAGAGYSEGFPSGFAGGDLVVAILAPDGSVRLEDRARIRGSVGPHGPSSPLLRSVFLDRAANLFVVRTIEFDPGVSPAEPWARYSILDGARAAGADPRSKAERRHDRGPIEAVLQPLDTSLLLVERAPERPDTSLYWRFELLDPHGAVAWGLQAPREPSQYWPAEALMTECEYPRVSSLLATPGPRRFELGIAWENARVTFEVSAKKQNSKWSVVEVARAPWKPATEAAPSTVPPASPIALKQLPTVEFDDWAAFPNERDAVLAFEPSASGALRLVRRSARREYEQLELDASGATTRTAKVTGLSTQRFVPHWTALSNGRWLAIQPGDGAERSRAWIVDGDTATARDLPEFPDWKCVAAARTSTGFVVLKRDLDDAADPALASFDAAGSLTWRIEHERREPPIAPDAESRERPKLDGAWHVAVGPDDSIYSLGYVDAPIQILDSHGWLRSRIELPTELKSPTTILDLHVEASGALLVCAGTWLREHWRRIELDGRSAALSPLRRDGNETSLGRSVRTTVDTTGRMWASIGAGIVRVDEHRRVTNHFGTPSPPTRAFPFGRQLTTDEQVNFIVADHDQRSIHVFQRDGDGATTLQIPPEAKLLRDGLQVLSGPHGRRRVLTGMTSGEWLDYDANEELVEKCPRDGNLARWLPNGELWVASKYTWINIRRVSEHGSERARIERLPNRRFFDSIHAIALGPANGVAVLTGDGAKCTVELYDVDGKHLRSIATPMENSGWYDHLYWRENWVLVAPSSEPPTLVSLRSGARHQLPELPGVPGFRLWALSPDGREVWCARTEPLSVLRFALPE